MCVCVPIQVLGLGRRQAVDYSIDERVPTLMNEENDYITFFGHKLGTLHGSLIHAHAHARARAHRGRSFWPV